MNTLPLFIAIPLAGAFIISLIGRRFRSAPDILSNLATISLGILSVASVFIAGRGGVLVYKVGGWIPPIGISLVLDGFTSFMLVTVNLIALFVNQT